MSGGRFRVITVVTLAGAAVLFLSGISLVTSQSRVRSLTAQIERLQNESKRLNDDATDLYMEISRAALPGYIATEAAKSGLQPATSRNTVTLEYKELPPVKGSGGLNHE
ncbi:hypothetical protein MAF45_07335 [Mesosutterella sp. OilRF-GAM-744-9]|uniref:Cell division protein FtsL n=1 Tax=Mesosutterella porci TaxID=2915351 RepID=A0ABS9MRK3_9BURK|nr:hypothetical protein [Mesosutterella sp. oilRF-744-WT-GAM-9]MCG5031251.1 hypothetical protein [Mesosutterella sp. oilRF-744-WT-GAM-9]